MIEAYPIALLTKFSRINANTIAELEKLYDR
jgi:hypothetical protein